MYLWHATLPVLGAAHANEIFVVAESRQVAATLCNKEVWAYIAQEFEKDTMCDVAEPHRLLRKDMDQNDPTMQAFTQELGKQISKNLVQVESGRARVIVHEL